MCRRASTQPPRPEKSIRKEPKRSATSKGQSSPPPPPSKEVAADEEPKSRPREESGARCKRKMALKR
jgi:hypothetical protein